MGQRETFKLREGGREGGQTGSLLLGLIIKGIYHLENSSAPAMDYFWVLIDWTETLIDKPVYNL